MNKIIFSGFLAFGLFVSTKTSAQTTTLKNSLSLSPFEFFNHTFQLGYERMLKDGKNGLVINAGLTASNIYDSKKMGAKGDAQFRFYFDKEHRNPERMSQLMMFAGPYVAYKYLDLEEKDYYYPNTIYDPSQPSYQEPVEYIKKREINSFGAGVLIGMRLAMYEKVNLDTFIGGGVKFTDSNTNSNRYDYIDITDPEYSGVYPRIGLTLGFKF